MSSKESLPAPSDPRPESYDQHKGEQGLDLIKARDFAHYFNGEMHSAVNQLAVLKIEIDRSVTLNLEEKSKMLDRITKIESKLGPAHRIANDAFLALKKSRNEGGINVDAE